MVEEVGAEDEPAWGWSDTSTYYIDQGNSTVEATWALSVALISEEGEEDQTVGRYVDGDQAGDLAYLGRKVPPFALLVGVDQRHSALLARMTVTEVFHSTRHVGFAEWN